MNLHLFKSDPLYSDVLEYWVKTWDSIANDLENGTFGIGIANIRIVLSDVIYEYRLNKFHSENNRKVYIHLIERFLKESHLKLYRNELRILKERLEATDNESTYVVAKELSKRIDNEVFSNVLFEELLDIIYEKNFSKKVRIKISKLTKEIIVDLITSGTQISDVKHAIHALFTTNSEGDNTNTSDLNVERRLKKFKEKLTPKSYEYTFVFPIWGIVCPANQIGTNKILDFLLYDPSIKKNFENQVFDESFKFVEKSIRGNITTYVSRCNAHIKIVATSNSLAIAVAKEKYSALINLLSYTFNHDHKIKKVFSDNQYFMIRMDGNHSQSDFPPPFHLDRELSKKSTIEFPFEFTLEKLYEIEECSSVITSLKERDMYIESNSILNVIELMEKSNYESPENKLLNYWICIESLASISKKSNENTFNFVKETISNMYFLAEPYMPIRKLFNSLNFYVNYTRPTTNELPLEFLEYVGLARNNSENNLVSLLLFYERLHELPFKIKDAQLLDMIEDTISFYDDNKIALLKLKSKKKEVELTIDYIYKSRNQLVHNGYVAKNIIPYLVKFVEGYAKSLFETIISVYSSGDFDLQSYFIKEKYKRQLLEKRLSDSIFFNMIV